MKIKWYCMKDKIDVPDSIGYVILGCDIFLDWPCSCENLKIFQWGGGAEMCN